MEENNKLKSITNEELLTIYKVLIEFVKYLEREKEKVSQEEVV